MSSAWVTTIVDEHNRVYLGPFNVYSPSPTSIVLFSVNCFAIVVVLECPDESYIASLLECEALLEAVNSRQDGDGRTTRATHAGVSLVVHFLPNGLFSSSAYQAFVSKYVPCDSHLWLPLCTSHW